MTAPDLGVIPGRAEGCFGLGSANGPKRPDRASLHFAVIIFEGAGQRIDSACCFESSKAGCGRGPHLAVGISQGRQDDVDGGRLDWRFGDPAQGGDGEAADLSGGVLRCAEERLHAARVFEVSEGDRGGGADLGHGVFKGFGEGIE